MFVLRHLDALISALTSFRIMGLAPLESAVMTFAMDVATLDPAIEAEVKHASPAAQSAMKKASTAMKKAVEVVAQSGKTSEAV